MMEDGTAWGCGIAGLAKGRMVDNIGTFTGGLECAGSAEVASSRPGMGAGEGNGNKEPRAVDAGTRTDE